MMELHILSECYIDTLLIKTLSPPRKRYNHQKSCNNVLKTMRDDFVDNTALGIIDDDKLVPKNFNSFVLLKKHSEQLAIYKHNDKPHYIIKISKAVEDFILKNAKKCNISLADYHLPTDITELKNITKHTKSLEVSKSKFKNLFSALKQNENSDFYKLAQWIELFKANPYNLNMENN